jgi:hypothetical protein
VGITGVDCALFAMQLVEINLAYDSDTRSRPRLARFVLCRVFLDGSWMNLRRCCASFVLTRVTTGTGGATKREGCELGGGPSSVVV